MSRREEAQVRDILRKVRPLAAKSYQLTKRPLGVTGELAEHAAKEKLGLKLAAARTAGYDARLGRQRIQIKGRAYGKDAKPGQRISRIKPDANCDAVLLVLLDNTTLEPREMYKAPFAKVRKLLTKTKAKARARGALSVDEFKTVAKLVWPR